MGPSGSSATTPIRCRKLSYKEIAARTTHQPPKPAYMEAVKNTVKDFPYMFACARGAFAIGSKVSKNVYEVDTLIGTRGAMRGGAKIGAGTSR